MSKLKILRVNVGIPGSGKTTYTRKFIDENPGWIRVSRDDFRFMLKNKDILDNKGETLVSELVNLSVRRSLLHGYNVVLDNTSVKLSIINDIVKNFNDIADIEFSVFDTPINVCIERDYEREKSVGEDIIESMNVNFQNLKKIFDFEPVQKKNALSKDYSKDWSYLLNNAVIFDVDGTLAHTNGKRGPFEWEKVELDDPDHAVVKILRNLNDAGLKIIIVSGRDAVCQEKTERWLLNNEIPYDRLFMRPMGDTRKDAIIKQEIFENLIKPNWNTIMVFDDRDQVVEQWRKMGVKCAQVEKGEF